MTARKIDSRLEELLAPGQCAVLIQELQESVVGASSGLPALAEVAGEMNLLAKVAAVAGMARRVGVPVIHCTAENLDQGFGANMNARLFAVARKQGMSNLPGSDAVRPMHEIYVEGIDIVLPRLHGLSPMTGSPLDSILRNHGVRTVVVMGVSLNIAIPNLVFDAVNRSYQVVLVADAVAGVPIEYGEQVLEHALSLVSTVVPSGEVIDTWSP
jgi:nicotinamidase-related amidase